MKVGMLAVEGSCYCGIVMVGLVWIWDEVVAVLLSYVRKHAFIVQRSGAFNYSQVTLLNFTFTMFCHGSGYDVALMQV